MEIKLFDGVVVENCEITNFKARQCSIFKIFAYDIESTSKEQDYHFVVSFGERKTIHNSFKFRDNRRFLFQGTPRRTRLTDQFNILDSKRYIELHDAVQIKPLSVSE
jgi:hypothetical protein